MNHLRDHSGRPMLLVGLGFLIIAAFFVNPFREMAFEDDFAYAWTVKHLIDTGQYQLHEWAAANPVVQVYWGALFEQVLGPHYGSLRGSTLVLAVFGVLALYGLAREHGLDDFMAGFITVVLVSCPLFLLFSFSFMTDVPFLAWVTIALFLYTRAIRLQSPACMIVASVAGSIAILTRQFGVAFIGGMLLLWILETCQRRQAPLFLIGIILPVIAAAWQFYQGTQTPQFGMNYAMVAQLEHFGTLRKLVGHIFWRPAIVPQYLVFFSTPLALWAVASFFKEFFESGYTTKRMQDNWSTRLLIGFVVYILLVMSWTRNAMPLLPWNLGELRSLGLTVQCLITIFTVIGSVAYVRIFLMRYLGKASWMRLPAEERLLDLVTLFLFVAHLVFFQIGDEYLLCLLPFTLIVIGKGLQEEFGWVRRVAVCASALVMIASVMWTRGTLEREEAIWKASESLMLRGVEKSRIFASIAWNGEHRFDEYFSGLGYDRPVEKMGVLFREWLPERKKAAQYLVISEEPYWNKGQTSEGETIMRIPYRTMLLRKTWATVVQKTP